MASSTYTAGTLKTCRNGTSWRSDHPYAGFGQGYTYDSISNIGYIGFSFNLAGKHITKISFTFTFDARGLGSWATKSIDFYRYVNSSSPTACVGSFIGGFSGTGMSNCTSTYTFDSSTNATCFNGLKQYFEDGGSILIIKAPSTDKTASGYNYTECYGQIGTAKVTIEYVDKYKITYDVNGGSGSIGQTELPYGVAGKTTSSTPNAPADSTVNQYTITFNGNGGTPSPSSRTNTVTHKYYFTGWNTKPDGSGSPYGSSANITITGPLTLYAQYGIQSSTSNAITSATASKASITTAYSVTFDYADGGATNKSEYYSDSVTSYTCTGWYTAASGGTKRVNTSTSFTPSKTETLYAQYSQSSTPFESHTVPTATREGYTFNGWLDAGGTIIYRGGETFTPSQNITYTASWTPIPCSLTIVDWLNGEVKYSDTVNYGTTFTLPSLPNQIVETSAGETRPFYFYDAQQNNLVDSVLVDLIARYRFEGFFARYENDQFSSSIEETGGDLYYYRGQTTTIRADTEFRMIFSPYDNILRCVMLPPPDATFGKRFQGWFCPDTGETYQASKEATFPDSSSYYFVEVWADVSDNYGKNLYLNVDGTMKQGTVYVKVNNQYVPAIAIFVKKEGVWRTKEG